MVGFGATTTAAASDEATAPAVRYARQFTTPNPHLARRGEKALAVVQQLLSGDGSSRGSGDAGDGEAEVDELADIQLFSFRAIPSSRRLDIRIDKMTGAVLGGGPAVMGGRGGRAARSCLLRHHRCLLLLAIGTCIKDFPLTSSPPAPLPPPPPNPADRYGSPTLTDVAAFSRAFTAAFEAAVGEEVAGGIELEVSSPVGG